MFQFPNQVVVCHFQSCVWEQCASARGQRYGAWLSRRKPETGKWGQREGMEHLHEKSCFRPMTIEHQGNVKSQQEVTRRVTHSSPLLGVRQADWGGSSVEVNGPSNSLILGVLDHRAAECVPFAPARLHRTEGGRTVTNQLGKENFKDLL